jgi:hypothetical protein
MVFVDMPWARRSRWVHRWFDIWEYRVLFSVENCAESIEPVAWLIDVCVVVSLRKSEKYPNRRRSIDVVKDRLDQ